uniref:Aluminum-activated malate transporter n=1 Tax=Chenopodium quinoa TaxID=63459 RepID=A0A803LX18_CHEQI
MESHRQSPNQETSSHTRNCFNAKFENLKTKVGDISKLTKQLAKDDPRRIVHTIKVGFAITLVSLFYYFDPFYNGLGVDAMWAVLTVVVVFKFSVGATLRKGVNRVVATVLGGFSAVGAHKLSSLPEEKLPMLEPLFLGLSVFLTAGVMTFIRFFPKIKTRFDYGLSIFILTFSLICVSGYRTDEILDMASRRITTILIGTSTAVIVYVVICPVWAGSDLHSLAATNLEILADFFQEFGGEYLKASSDAFSKDNNKLTLDRLKKVVDSKNNVDSLFNLAMWEPRHRHFKYDHPWTQYQNISELARRCACRAEVLHSFLYTQVQTPTEVKAKFREACMMMSTESGKALKELSLAIKRMNQPSNANHHVQNAKQAAENLYPLLRSNIRENLNLSDVKLAATVATILADVVACTEEIAKAVQELASLAKFKDKNNTVVDGRAACGINRNKLANQGSINRSYLNNNQLIIIHDGDSSPLCSPKISISDQDPPSLAIAQQNAE